MEIDLATQVAYDTMVKTAYQGGATIRPFVRHVTNVRGRSYNFRRADRGTSRPHVPVSPRVPMGGNIRNVAASLQAWDATDYVDLAEKAEVSFDETRVVSENVGKALGRREDQLTIDALQAAKPSADVAAGGTGLTELKMRQVLRFFDDRAIPRGDRTILISAKGKSDLMGEQLITSIEFGQTMAAREGELPTIYGFRAVVIDTRPEGGLPLASGVRTLYAFDREAVGLAVAQEPVVRVDWVPHLTAWQVNAILYAGAAVIDPEGVLRVDIVET